MKKLIVFLALITVAVISYSQDVTHTKDMPVNGTYQFINGLPSDTLVDGGQDSIDFIFKNHNAFSYDKISIGFQIDTVKGSDNGVVYSLYGKEFANDPTWVAIIEQDTTADVAGIDQYYTAKQATIATDKSFAQFRVRLFMEATSDATEKLKIDKVEINTYQK